MDERLGNTKYLGGRYPRSKAFERKWLAAGDPVFGNAQFIIETLAERRAIGWVGLHQATSRTGLHHSVSRSASGTILDGGYGTDAMRTACRFGFEMMNLHRIELDVYDWNPRAMRVYEKVGFQYEGTIRDGIFKAGRWNDLVCMGLLRGELR